MLECATDAHASTSLHCGLLITKILLYYSIYLSVYLVVEVSATYDSKTFASMGYILLDNEWCKKDSAKEKSNLPKVSKSISNPMFHMLMELEEIKDQFKTIDEGLILLQESTTRLLQLGKDTNSDVGKVRLSIDIFKQVGIKIFNKMFDRVESIKF